MADTKQPRGLRNNNPLNLVKSRVRWRGLVNDGQDPTFATFDTLQNGCRAAVLNLRTYINYHAVNTPSAIIHRWSPDGEDKERAYLNYVCTRTGLRPNQYIAYSDRDKVCALLHAMAAFECGQDVPLYYFTIAYDSIGLI